MPNASQADTRAGWEVFKASGFTATLEHVNRRLIDADYGPVSKRTHNHYRKLAREGFSRYISTNRLDVSRASRPYENASANERYSYYDVDATISIAFARQSRLVEASGHLDKLGDVGASLIFEGDDVVSALRLARLHSGDAVTLNLAQPPRTMAARVIEAEVVNSKMLVEVEFARLQSVVEYMDRRPLPEDVFRFRLETTNADKSIDLVGRRVYYFLELIEASRALVNDRLKATGSTGYATAPTVERMQLQSPLEFLVATPTPVATVASTALASISTYVAIQFARLRKFEADGKGEEARRQRIENDQAEAVARTTAAVHEALRSQLPSADEASAETPRQDILLRRQLITLLQNLAAQDVADASVERYLDNE